MSMHRKSIRSTFHYLTIALMLVTGTVSWAEVGVVDLGPANPYLMRSIVDDPDPQVVWTRYSADSDTRKILNDAGAANGDGAPSMLFHTASGQPVVSWSMNSPAGFDVVLSTFADGAWTAPLILAASSHDELDPFLVQDPVTGEVHLFYWVFDGSPRVVHRQAPADLSSWTAPVIVSQPGEIASRPTAAFHGGVLHVAYESHGTTFGSLPRSIVLAEKVGAGYTSTIVATSFFAEPNRPEVHSVKGKLWVDWIDDADEMTWRREVGSGSWEPLELETFDGVEERDFHVRGAIKAVATGD